MKILKLLTLALIASTSLISVNSARAYEESDAVILSYGSDEELIGAIDAIIETVVELEQYVSLQDAAAYLRPIKVYGGKAKATIAGRGDHSVVSLAAVRTLITRIQASARYIEKNYQINATFELAIALETQAQYLDDLID